MDQQRPSDEYLTAIRILIKDVSARFPGVFFNTRYFFDPAEILRPCFIQIYRISEDYYLYLFRPNLEIHLADSVIINQATNDESAAYTSRRLFYDSLFIPIDKPSLSADGGEISVRRLFSSTWMGESGSGYRLNGQWADRDLSKYLSTIFTPVGFRIYPYFPFRCDFNTLCLYPFSPSAAARKLALPLLHKAFSFIAPYAGRIEDDFRSGSFSADSEPYKNMALRIPSEWTNFWTSLKIKPYLNSNDMKEYLLEFKSSK